MRKCFFVSAFLVVALLFTSTAFGQVSASLSGTVTDPSGAAVVAAAITVENVGTGMVRTTSTDGSGRYQVFSLPAGEYEVHAKKQGFSEEVRKGIELVVGEDATANLTLRLGEISEQVVVTEDAPLINVTTADISGLVGEQQVKDLPLNGRSYDELLTLNPGVVNFTWEKTGGIGVSNSTTANDFAVSGNRPQQNLFLLNGVEYTGAAENNMQPGGASGLLLGVDAVREFNVLRDTYGAEYGKHPGAQVAIVTQSGTNQLHGNVFEFLRNNDLDAREFLRPRLRAALPAQSIWGVGGRAAEKIDHFRVWQLRGLPRKFESDGGNRRPGRGTRSRSARGRARESSSSFSTSGPSPTGPNCCWRTARRAESRCCSPHHCRPFARILERRGSITFSQPKMRWRGSTR